MLKKTKVLLLTVLMVVFFTNSVAMAVNSTASVGFKEGTLEFGEIAGEVDMDLDFGTNFLPEQNETYFDDAAHTLTVRDLKSSEQNWSVTGKLSAFNGDLHSGIFNGTITLSSGTAANPSVTPYTEIVLVSGESGEQPVMDASQTLIGTYSIEWAANDISLAIGTTAVEVITEKGPDEYSATLTWSLNVAP